MSAFDTQTKPVAHALCAISYNTYTQYGSEVEGTVI